MTDTAKLRALLDAATPGPWFRGYYGHRCRLDHGRGPGGHGRGDCKYETEVVESDNSVSSSTVPRDGSDIVAGMWDYEDGGVRLAADADLIVALRNAAPDMLTELDALRAKCAAYEAGIRQAREDMRERCAKVVEHMGHYGLPAEHGTVARCASAVRALPLEAPKPA